MLTRKEYSESIHNLNGTPNEKIIEFENYIRKSKEYRPYISPLNEEIVQNYDREMEFLNSLQQRNENEEKAIERNKDIKNIISLTDKKEQEREAKIQKENQLVLRREKTAGFTNATAIIFVVLNLGVFLASLLFILK